MINSDDSQTVIFDTSDGASKLSLMSNDGVLAIKKGFPLDLINGEFTCKGNTLNYIQFSIDETVYTVTEGVNLHLGYLDGTT